MGAVRGSSGGDPCEDAEKLLLRRRCRRTCDALPGRRCALVLPALPRWRPLLAGCGHPDRGAADPGAAQRRRFPQRRLQRVTDADVTAAAGSADVHQGRRQRRGLLLAGELHASARSAPGMGISTWWYRGSDLDVERTLEQKAGRDITELDAATATSGFKASDANACSIYVAKGGDVITWSMQTLNPAMLPRPVRGHRALAQLSQDRVN